MKKVLVTGSDGYIGSVLTPYLASNGFAVTGLDTGFYRAGWLFHTGQDEPLTHTQDTRRLSVQDFSGFDAVVHLAELSNDPTSELDPAATFAINHQASVNVARLAKEAGVRRFVYASSCSVYGVAEKDVVNEQSALNPQTAYATCKTRVEKDVQALASEQFSPTFLRNATAFGASPRMRFDLVLNNLAAHAWTSKTIRLTSDGSPWRPLVHILDISHAIFCALEAPEKAVHNQIFNVGDSEGNYRVKDIAEIVAGVFPDAKTIFGPPSGDTRSYRVSFEKIHTQLPGFRCRWNARKGAEQLRDVFDRLQFTPEMFTARPFTRLEQLKYLLKTRQLDKDFFWQGATS